MMKLSSLSALALAAGFAPLTVADAQTTVGQPGANVVPGTLAVDGAITSNPPSNGGNPLLDLQGAAASGASGGQPGVVFSYTDGTTGSSLFQIQRYLGQWQWQVQDSSGVGSVQMQLNSANALTLYDPSRAGNNIVLTPGASGQISINGSPVATQSFGAMTYMPKAPTQFVSGGATALSAARVAIGDGANATAYDSYALGCNSSATNMYSVAIGLESAAKGDYATAFGTWSWATGSSATALGGGTASGASSTAIGGGISNGLGSVCLGYYSNSVGDYAGAFGFNTEADSLNELSVGVANVPGAGDPHNWLPADNLFVVGNGLVTWYYDRDDGWWYDTTPSNALVIKKNGDTTVYGGFTVTDPANNANQAVVKASQTLLGVNRNSSVDANHVDHSQGVLIVGAGSGIPNDPARNQNGMRILADGTVLVKAKGDLTMGAFTNGPTP